MKGLNLAVVFAHFSTGDNAQAANQVKMAQILEFTRSIRTPLVIAAGFNLEPDQLWDTGWVQNLSQKANIVVRMKSKTKPEEPIDKEVKFACEAEHWESAAQSQCKTRSGHPNVVSQSVGVTATGKGAY